MGTSVVYVLVKSGGAGGPVYCIVSELHLKSDKINFPKKLFKGPYYRKVLSLTHYDLVATYDHIGLIAPSQYLT